MAWRGRRPFGQRSQELKGWFVEFMVDAGVQVFVDWMVLVHRRIVGRWICQRIEPNPVVADAGHGPSYTSLYKALLESLGTPRPHLCLPKLTSSAS